MIADIIFPLVALIGSFLGAASDFKTREVPNWINYFMIIFGLGGFLIISIARWSIWPILFSLGGGLIFYGVAAFMFYLGQWGGGDAKMLIGFGTLLPVYPLVLLNFFSPKLSFWPWIATLFFNIILVGGIFGLLSILFLIVKNFSAFKSEFKLQINRHKKWIQSIIMVLFIPIILYFIDYFSFIASVFSWLIMGFLFFSYLIASSVEKACMVNIKKPKDLTVGDWLARDVSVGGKIICKSSRTGLKEKDIALLTKYKKQNKLNEVYIREGLPFTYAFFIGLLISLIFGDMIFILIGAYF